MKTTNKKIKKIIKENKNQVYSFFEPFLKIIKKNVSENYLNDLEVFFKDLQKGGCQAGWINDFCLNQSCKDFYIKHLDDLEEYILETEENLGVNIENKQKLQRPVFVVWFCFEQFCFELQKDIFE